MKIRQACVWCFILGAASGGVVWLPGPWPLKLMVATMGVVIAERLSASAERAK